MKGIKSIVAQDYFTWAALLLIAIVSQTLFAISVSPATPFEGFDSCVFKQMGQVILQGKTPYLDVFDHKGPIIYFINAFGQWIGLGRWGLFFLVVLNCYFILLFWYKIACHYVSKHIAYFPVILTLVMYLAVMEEGNMTEDWCLLPISYSLFIASRMISYNKPINSIESLIIGLSAGIIVFIRANNMALLICSVILMSYLLIKNKEWATLAKTYSMMAVGAIIVTAGCALYFYISYGQNGIDLLFYGTFIFNLGYSGWNSYYDFFISSIINHAFFLAAIVVCVFSMINNKDDHKRSLYTSFFTISFLFCFFTMGRTAFRHYMITVIPLFAMSSSYAFRNGIKEYVLSIMVYLLIAEPFFKKQIQYTMGQVKRAYVTFYKQADETISSIEESERDKIWNYNSELVGLGVLQHNKLIQANRVILNFQRKCSEKLEKSVNGKLQEMSPKYLLVDPTHRYISKEDSIFICNNYKKKRELKLEAVSKNADVRLYLNFLEHK